MSLKENLDDFNYTLKESYYQLEDRIGFPPILLLGLIIAGALIYFYIINAPRPNGENGPQIKYVTAKFYAKDEMERFVENVSVEFEFDHNSLEKKTDSDGMVSLQVPEKTALTVRVKEEEFEEYTKTFEIEESNYKDVIRLKLKEKPPVKITLRFEDESGIIRGKEIQAIVVCRNGETFGVEDRDGDGIIEVELPKECEDIRVKDVHLPGYEIVETGRFGGGKTRVVKLRKKEVPKGSVRFKLLDQENHMLTGENFTITLHRNADEFVKQSAGYAIVVFQSIPVGAYSVSLRDENNNYVPTNPNALKTVTVEKNKTIEKEIVFSKKVKGTIKVNVIDKATGERIPNADVLLMDNSNTVLQEQSTDKNAETIVFKLFEEGNYRITAKKEGGINKGYFPKTVKALDLNSEVDLKLERVTEQNTGQTIVRVKDEEGKPVRDAKVMFRYEETGGVVQLTETENYKLTDTNGKAEFMLDSIEEKVYAYAVKYPASGGTKQQAKKIDPLNLNEFNVTLVIGESSLKLKTIDSSGDILAQSYFEIFDQQGNSVTKGRVPLTSGETTYNLKADKTVYLIFSKQGYLDYQSEEIELWPDETIEITAMMRKKGEILEPTIEFKGAFENNEPTQTLRAGKTYNFKFALIYPHNKELDLAGFHFRTGNKAELEKDALYISRVNAPNSEFIEKGLTYRPSENASEEQAVSKSKWVNVKWTNPKSGIYSVSMEARVKKAVYPNSVLSINYRAWSEKDNRFARTPYDEELGEEGSIPGKNGLYAKTLEQVYYEGSQPFCDQNYCIKGEWLYDKQEDIFQSKPYSLMVLADYNFILSLLNNSSKTYEDKRIVVKNVMGGDKKRDLRMDSLIFYNADGDYFKETPQDYEFSLQNVGQFNYLKDLNVNIALSPRKPADTQLLFQFIGDREIVFEKRFDFHIMTADEFSLKVEPMKIAAFEETELRVELTGKEEKKPIGGALVRLTRESPDGLYQVLNQTSNEDGVATFEIPASTPLTKIRIEAEKMGFMPKSKELTVGENAIDYSPIELSSSLNTISQTEETLNVSLENKTGADFLIKNLRFSGEFKGLLNEVAMESYLSAWIGKTLKAHSEEGFALLKTILASNVKEYLTEPETVNGELEIVIFNQEYFVEYSIVIPVQVNVSLGGSPDNTPCVHIDGVNVPEWNATIMNNQAVNEFEIYNSCRKGGKKIDVKNLQAKLVWEKESKKAGVIELTIFNPEGKAVTEVLRPGEWTVLWSKMGSADFGTYQARINFTPKTGYLNETAEFQVLFDAEVETDQGTQRVNNGEVSVNGSILVLNLEDCLSMPGTGERVVIAEDEEETTFEINASECSSNVFVSLCLGDPKCRGGTQEGGITLSQREFSLKESNPSQTITVYRDRLPGLYGIPVYARLPNNSLQRVKTIDLLVEPRGEKWFSLNRYEAILSPGTDWVDTVELKNTAPLDLVDITAKYCTKCPNPSKPDSFCVWNLVEKQQAQKKGRQPWLEAVGWGVGAGVTCWCVLSGNIGNCVDTAKDFIPIVTAPSTEHAGDSIAYLSGENSIEMPFKTKKSGESQNSEKKIKARFLIDPITDALICGGVGILTTLWYGFTAKNKCLWEYQTRTVRDYIVRLNDDSGKRLSLEEEKFEAKWGTFNNHQDDSLGTETAPIELTNKAKEATVEPVYEVLTVSATEHIHNDPTHNAPKMTMDSADFGELDIPDTDSRKYEQKFHLKFKTKQTLDLELPPLDDYYSCISGSKVGVTGKAAKPRIKLNWSWGESGIGLSECNPENGIYCDATQFSISLSKRIHRVNEFLAANNYDLKCPRNPKIAYSSARIDKINSEESSNEVENGKIGLKSIGTSYNSKTRKAILTITVQNNTGSDENATVKIGLSGPNDFFEECEKTLPVRASNEATAECEFSELEKSDSVPYIAVGYLSESTATSMDATQLRTGFFLSEPNTKECWLPFSTERYQGHAVMEYFFNKNIPNWEQYLAQSSVKWPGDWPGSSEVEKIEYLRSLFEFKAKLIKDNYTKDFQKDFAEHYSKETFFEVPSWFYSGSSSQLVDYFADPNRIEFKQKYSSNPELPGPGTYNVYITIDFGSGDWGLYKEGKPKGNIKVEFYKLSEPQFNSAFYYLPFDGMVGIESENGRQGYGLNYLNEGQELQIKKAPNSVFTKHSPESTALLNLETFKKQGLKYLNSSASNRGSLLSVEVSSAPTIVFSPSYATPVILRVENKENSPISARFNLLENNTPTLTGSNLSYWTGLGQCADFSGLPIREAFDFYPDERSAEKAYEIEWETAPNTGKVFLFSVFYSPLSGKYQLNAVSENSRVLSPDSGLSKTVELNGIKGMSFNSSGSEGLGTLNEILTLVEKEYVCVTNSGNKSSFWWNPKALRETEGKNLSISEFEQTLKPGKTCIGPGE